LVLAAQQFQLNVIVGNVSSDDVSEDLFSVTYIVVTSLTLHTEFADASLSSQACGVGTNGFITILGHVVQGSPGNHHVLFAYG